jgi:methanogenic corrinoid protein MtbC1
MNIHEPFNNVVLSIAAVERDTGIGKDTLRVWERRYGFPTPGRDANDERVYPMAQVEKLRIIKRLLDQGHRPGRIVAKSVEELQHLSQAQVASPQPLYQTVPSSGSDLRPYIELLKVHDNDGLRRQLNQIIAREGLKYFVTDLVAPLTRAVGDAWMRGELEVFEEHAYTECVTGLLRHAINALTEHAADNAPAVLLTTFPQESHGLGLLMAESMLALEGCRCISLGTQTPLRDIVQAAGAHKTDVVALSFSMSMNVNHVMDGLAELRQLLPATVEVWAGGQCAALQRREQTHAVVLRDLVGISNEVKRWRKQHAAKP